jgi:heterodisulfide reductase subunit A-like polyferredoxin
VDLAKCTSCGECAKACPISVENAYNEGLDLRKAAYKQYAQAIPGAFAIEKRGTAPCKATCPAHVSIQGYIALINDGRYAEAVKLFKEEHPFPAVCGRVCHHPCEKECTRNDVDKPLAIRELHRFLADFDKAQEKPFVPEIAQKRDEKIAIIGSGPAGLTCAYMLARDGYQVTVFEKLPVTGGMMAVGIPDYRLPRQILDYEIDVIKDMGVDIKTNMAFGTDITLESLKADGYSAVFLAIGLHGGRSLGIPGENAPGVIQSVDLLRDVALGKEVKVGDRVLVIGGGNVAIDAALTAKRLGAGKVTMVCLEKREEMPAWEHEIEEALEGDIEIVNSFGPKDFELSGDKVAGLSFRRCTCVFDPNGRFCPEFDEADCTTLEADTVVLAIGQSAVLDFAKKEGIAVTNRGGLEADPLTLQTPVEWVFAGGDAHHGPKSVVEAVEAGKKAAESIVRYIKGEDLAAGRARQWDFVKPDTLGEPQKDRVAVGCLDPEARECNFLEVSFGYTEEQAKIEADRCLKCGICSECYQCVDACLAHAIDHNQQAREITLEVGSVVLSPGCEPYDPSSLELVYRYKSSPNVVTSLEFERILSASGPTLGHLARPSDGKEPEKIAWLQCIGSRDTNKCGNGYCSSVCCMYAIKDAMIAKEHSHKPLDAAIFNMDIRTFGKDYERYYLRAKDKDGVRFVKARVHTVDVDAPTGDLLVRYADDSGAIQTETFDMVVLSVGLQIQKDVQELAERIGVEVDKYRFAENDPFAPVATSRPGVFASGVFQSPKDIPSSITQASAAACAAGVALAEARNTRTRSVEKPVERDVAAEEPRIGVFVCKCGINIAGVVDVPAVRDYAASLPGVAFAGDNLFTCSQDAQDNIKKLIDEHKLNRIVVASCTPKTHEGIFMDTLESVGLNKYLFEMANIRNQDSWVHNADPAAATKKAKELVHMAVARAATLSPLHDKSIPVTRKALVVGGGIAGMTAALSLADQNYEVALVEKEARLGGMALNLTRTIEGKDVGEFVKALAGRVQNHEKIDVFTDAIIVGFSGFKGNFTTEIIVGEGLVERKIKHGVAIMATGATEYQPTEYLYGQDQRVMTQVELAKKLKSGEAGPMDAVVMIQCVGSRNEQNPNCSRICCQSAVKNAIAIKKSNPDAGVYILYRDMRTDGLLEEYYTQARKEGVLFFRYDPENPPQVESSDEGVLVTFTDHVLGLKVQVAADILALSAGMVPADTEELCNIMKIGRNPDGYLIEAHVKLRPVDMGKDGVFLCGTAHSPKLITEAVAQAQAAASRAVTMLAQERLTLSAVTATVIQEKCASCLICVRSCPFDVPRINEDGVSEIDPALCQGCGVCASECPAKAIYLNWYEDNQILSKVDALLEGVL